MSLDYLIENYGYAAILIGTFLEGEAVVILGGLTAKLGHLSLQHVIFFAVIGTVIGDQTYFFIGRRYGKSILEKKPAWQAKAERVDALMVKWDIYLLFGYRYLYGLRTVTSLMFGMSSVPVKKFMIINSISAVIWAVIMGSIGYILGHSAELFMNDFKKHGLLLLMGLLSAGLLLWWGINTYRAKRAREDYSAP